MNEAEWQGRKQRIDTRFCPANKSKFAVFDRIDGTLIRCSQNVSSFDIEPPGQTPLMLPQVIEKIWQNVNRDYHGRILTTRLLPIDGDMNARSVNTMHRTSFVMANRTRIRNSRMKANDHASPDNRN